MTIMFHQVTPAMLQLDYGTQELTFDDALLSVAAYAQDIAKRYPKNKKILFISPALINTSPSRKTNAAELTESDLLTAEDAMSRHMLHNDQSGYMSIELIQHVLDAGFTLGIHGWSHETCLCTSAYTSLATGPEWRRQLYSSVPECTYKFYKVGSVLAHKGHVLENGRLVAYDNTTRRKRIYRELRLCHEWIYEHFDRYPLYFALPFNDTDAMLTNIIHDFRHTIYGGERTAVEMLLE